MYKKTFSSYSFGCRVNEAEKQVMDECMIRSGYEYDSLKPDIFIVNTCAVTTKAEREARQIILKLKRRFPNIKIVATGCSATYWQKNEIWRNMPIDLLISNTDKDYTVEIIRRRFEENHPQRPTIKTTSTRYWDKFLSSGRVMVKIQDGCNRFCSYCIVPYLRGLPRSRRIKDIVTHIETYQNEMKEVVLTAINTHAYGVDTGESLIDLIRRVLEKTKIERLSFGSVHPWSLTEKFIAYYKSIAFNERFSNFFHIPLQSGSDKILRLMKRDYSRKEISDILHVLAKINPKALIATDIIAGFLDETDSDFEDALSFLRQSPISKFHIFRFSKRSNTAASYMSKRLKEPTQEQKKKRAKALEQLNHEKYHSFLNGLVGYRTKALFIGQPKDGYQKAVLNNQIPSMIRTNKNLSGCMKHVTITELKKDCLIGDLD